MATLSLKQRNTVGAYGMANVDQAVKASDRTGLPLPVALGLLEQESPALDLPNPFNGGRTTGGANVWGHDPGALNTLPGGKSKLVEVHDFLEYFDKVEWHGGIPNGVGPCQITYAGGRCTHGYRSGGRYREMFEMGLRPWDAYENMLYGFNTFKVMLDQAKGNVKLAPSHGWNGAATYGTQLATKVTAWQKRLAVL